MKYCPQCHKEYTEVWITFCSDDGTILVDTGYQPSAQQPFEGSQRPPYTPPSEQHTWRSPDPNAPGAWVNPAEQRPPVTPVWQPPPPPAYPRQNQSQGLAIGSMIVGIISLIFGTFCFGPIPGIIALVLGLISLSQVKKGLQPASSKPLAVIGIVTGSLSVAVYGGIMLLAIISSIFS